MSSPSMADGISRPGNRRTLALLGAVALAAHLPALRNGFVLDDRDLLVDNPYVRTLSGLGTLLRHEMSVAAAEPRVVPYYRPVSGLLNWLSFQALGASAPLQHALNLVLHALVTMLLFAVLSAHRVRPGIARGAALVFAVHPVTSEVAAYLGGRQDTIGWIVGLGAALLLLRVQSVAVAALLAFAACFVGVLCHEFFFALPLPLALLAASGEGRAARLRGVATLVAGIGAVFAVMRLRSFLTLLDYEVPSSDPVLLLTTTVGVALRLLRDVAWPTDLAVDVTVAPFGLAFSVLAATAAAAAALGLVLLVYKRQKAQLYIALGGLSIVALSAGLHAGVALKYGYISDRYAYATLVGFVLLAGALASLVPAPAADASALQSLARRWGVALLAVAMVPMAWARDVSWRDETSLQLAMIADRPSDPQSQLAAAGLIVSQEGDLERAYPLCRAYAKARPESAKANYCIGTWLLVHRRPAEAVVYLRPYALSRPGIERARRALLAALFASRALDEASETIDAWSRMFEGAPDLAEARATLESLRRSAPPPQLPQTPETR